MKARLLSLTAATAVLAVPAAARSPDGSAHTQPTVVELAGNLAILRGAGIGQFAPRMPLLCSEHTGDRAGLVTFEATVISTSADTASIAIADEHRERARLGAICEPRFVVEARTYRATLKSGQPDPSRPTDSSRPAEPQRPKVRHRPPHNAPYGKPIWLEAVLSGPADKLFCYWRMGEEGAFSELPMEARQDGLFVVSLVLTQSDPPPRSVQYYLVAQGPGGRFPVFGDPAEPRSLPLDAVPETHDEQLVVHAPPDRATHRKPLLISAEINKRFTRPMLCYRARGSGLYLKVPMTPSGPDQYSAEIPARDVVTPGVAYYIAVMDEKGIVREGFSSARSPWNVTVLQPQILSAESNRNRLSFQYARANHGADNDHWQNFDAGLERLFFGFLVARLSAAAWLGESPSGIKSAATGSDPVTLPHAASTLPIYVGRAGLDLNIGDYVGITADLDMGTFKSGAGLGYRASARIGDEHVASIEIGIEQIWDIDAGNLVFDVKKGTLRIPFGDDWRIVATAAQDRILTDAPKAIRIGAGVEVDLGSHFAVSLSGGAAGRKDQLGMSLNSGVALRF